MVLHQYVNMIIEVEGVGLRHTSLKHERVTNSYTMGCPLVRGDNPHALVSGLSYIQVDKHGITILYHLHQCRPCTL